MDVLGLALEDKALTWAHAHNTLVISYVKPPAVTAAERREVEEAMGMRAKEGDVDCKTQ